MPAFIDLTGFRFGRLLARVRSQKAAKGVRWSCLCDCGTVCDVAANKLRSGHTQSCGCLQRERSSQANFLHGESTYPNGGRATKEYNTWGLMKKRCLLETSPDFYLYGGRGIRVCPRWESSFAAFIQDMGPAPTRRHSIDRIDPDGDYSPENCRWADSKTQRRNQRGNKFLVCRGESKTPMEWAEISGVNNKRIYARIKRGWDIERAIFTPV